MKASAEMIVGECDCIRTVCLAPDDGKDELATKFEHLEGELQDCETVTVIADLLGGSPCNVALERYVRDGRVSVVSGMNLAMVISAMTEGADAQALVVSGHEAIHDVKALAEGMERSHAEGRTAAPSVAAPASSESQTIVGVRVDSRGIHGQVATAWVPRLDVTRIMVVDDIAVRDETQKLALKMAKPSSVKLSILSTSKAAERLSDERSYPGERVFVVMSRVETLKDLTGLGLDFDTVNLGNVPSRHGTTAYAKCVSLTEDEAQIVRDLAARGTRFIAQQVPNDPEEDLTASFAR